MVKPIAARLIHVFGTVQGVGFRPFVYRLAGELGLHGWVQNRSGDVLIQVEGPPDSIARFVELLTAELPPLARIDRLDQAEVPPSGATVFSILASEGSGGHQPVSPDAALCAACRSELLDPSDPRYRYPFINCTDCGPRYTIIEQVPYDRVHTTMSGFPMCDYCAGQYQDPADRRFHAQPVACPVCGPSIWYEEGSSAPVLGTDEALRSAASCCSAVTCWQSRALAASIWPWMPRMIRRCSDCDCESIGRTRLWQS